MNPAIASPALHLHKLAVEIGPRPIGSPGNRAAANYIHQIFRAAGLTVEEQNFACPAWEEHGAWLTLNHIALPVVANTFSPACAVTAPMAACATLAELEGADLAGCVAVLYGDLAVAPLAPKAWALRSERDARIVHLLETKRPAAVVAVQTRPGACERLIEDADFVLPSVTVPPETGLALLTQAGAAVHLHIDSHLAAGHTANIVGRLAGIEPTQIVLCAHYDTKFDTPGAWDNASGAAVLLTLAQQLAQRRRRYGLEFVAFTGEEYLPLGDDEYVRRRGNAFAAMAAAVNIDGVGQWLGAPSLAMFAESPAFRAAMAAITAACPEMVWVDPWPESNHSTFAWRGVPSIAISTRGGLRHHHLRSDMIEWINPAALEHIAAWVEQIVARIELEEPAWTRPLAVPQPA